MTKTKLKGNILLFPKQRTETRKMISEFPSRKWRFAEWQRLTKKAAATYLHKQVDTHLPI